MLTIEGHRRHRQLGRPQLCVERLGRSGAQSNNRSARFRAELTRLLLANRRGRPGLPHAIDADFTSWGSLPAAWPERPAPSQKRELDGPRHDKGGLAASETPHDVKSPRGMRQCSCIRARNDDHVVRVLEDLLAGRVNRTGRAHSRSRRRHPRKETCRSRQMPPPDPGCRQPRRSQGQPTLRDLRAATGRGDRTLHPSPLVVDARRARLVIPLRGDNPNRAARSFPDGSHSATTMRRSRRQTAPMTHARVETPGEPLPEHNAMRVTGPIRPAPGPPALLLTHSPRVAPSRWGSVPTPRSCPGSTRPARPPR